MSAIMLASLQTDVTPLPTSTIMSNCKIDVANAGHCQLDQDQPAFLPDVKYAAAHVAI
jgi:hypothetical protein